MTAAIREQIEQSDFSNFGEIKTLFGQMLDLIDAQQQKIVALDCKNDKLIHNHGLIKRNMLDIERYSSKSYLIFQALDATNS